MESQEKDSTEIYSVPFGCVALNSISTMLNRAKCAYIINKKFWEELFTYSSLIQHGSHRK
jgi:hypothetical protein